MTIGIIMPVYNSRATILRAVASVLNQTTSDWVLYIIDDFSSDQSVDLIKQTYSDKRFMFYRNDFNQGAAVTRNRGIELCNEDYIAFIDSDDEWAPDKLNMQVKEIESGFDFILTDYIYSKPDGKIRQVSFNADKLSENDFLKKKFKVCFPSLCVKSDERLHFKKIGHEDFDFLYQCFKLYGNARVINQPLVICYETANSLSSNKIKAAKWHYSILKKLFPNNIIKRFYYFYWYVIRALKFKFKMR